VQRYQQHGEAEPADRHKTPPDLEQRRATTLPANPLQMPTPCLMPASAGISISLHTIRLPRYQWTFLESRTRLRLITYSREISVLHGMEF